VSVDVSDAVSWTSSAFQDSVPGAQIEVSGLSGTQTFTASVNHGGLTGCASVVVDLSGETPPPPVVQKLDITVATTKDVYTTGEVMLATFEVTVGTTPVEGAYVRTYLYNPDPALGYLSAAGSTDANGIFQATWKINGKANRGTYKIEGFATKQGYLQSDTATTSFDVR
jgi:hypothetical protein